MWPKAGGQGVRIDGRNNCNRRIKLGGVVHAGLVRYKAKGTPVLPWAGCTRLRVQENGIILGPLAREKSMEAKRTGVGGVKGLQCSVCTLGR